jgi:hypothetical protein
VAQVDAAYAAALAGIPDGSVKSDGIAVGQAAAAAILTVRVADHATTQVAYTPGTQPGDWVPTPNPVPFDPPARPTSCRRASWLGPGHPVCACGEAASSSRTGLRDCRGSAMPVITTKSRRSARRQHDPNCRTDLDRPFLVRRLARRLEPDRPRRRRLARSRLVGHGASARARQPRDGRRVHRGIPGEVRLQFLAPGDRDPRRRHGRERCDGRRSFVVDAAQHTRNSRLHVDPQRPGRRRGRRAASVLSRRRRGIYDYQRSPFCRPDAVVRQLFQSRCRKRRVTDLRRNPLPLGGRGRHRARKQDWPLRLPPRPPPVDGEEDDQSERQAEQGARQTESRRHDMP